MLVLSRKKSEMIRIGDDIVIKVIRTGSGCVKLGIEAPAGVRVLRAELCERDADHVVEPADEREEAEHPAPFLQQAKIAQLSCC